MSPAPRNRFIQVATAAYVLFALVWIFLSDQLMGLFTDVQSVLWLSTVKGVFFVLATGAIFYLALTAVPSKEDGQNQGLLDQVIPTMRSKRAWLGMPYAFALLVTLSALLVRQALNQSTAQHSHLILLILPIVLSALLGGLWPGLVSTFLAVLGADYFNQPHFRALRFHDARDLFPLALLALNGVVVSQLSHGLRKALARLKAQSSLLEAVITGTPDAIYAKDLSGRYQLANNAAAQFMGKNSADVVGRTDMELFPPDMAKVLQDRTQVVLQEGVINTHEETILSMTGVVRTFLVTKGPVRDATGAVTGIFGISRDITDRKKAEQALQKNEQILLTAQELAGIGNWEWNVLTGHHHWSAEIYRIYGRDPALGPIGFPQIQELFTPNSWTELTTAIDLALQNGETYACDAEVERPDGTHVWIIARGSAVKDAQGKVIRLQGTVQNITERKLNAIALQASEERLQLALDANTAAVWDLDLRTGYAYRSPNYFKIVGKSEDEDTHDFDFFRRSVHADDWPRVEEAVARTRDGLAPSIDMEYRLASSTNPVRWMLARGRVVTRDSQGQALRMVGTLTDITDRKRESDDLQTVLSEAGDAIFITDSDANFVYANPASMKLLGYSLDELKRMHVPDLIEASRHEALAAHFLRLDQHLQIRDEWDLLHRDGSLVPMELSTKRLADGRYIAFGRDLTEKKQADAALREREKQLARVIEGSDQGYWDWNLVSNKFTVSARWESMLGYEAGEMNVSLEHWGDHVHPYDLALAITSIQSHLKGITPSHDMEMRVRAKSGDWRWIQTVGRVVERSADGTPLIMSGTHTDITDRKMLELAQREANTVFTSSYEGIMVVSPERLITKINPAFTRITGYAASDIIGQSPAVLSSGQQDPTFYRDLWASLHKLDFWRGELWNRRKNGEIYPELLSISVVRNGRGAIEHYVGVFSDISQLKAHESELDRIAHYDPLTGLANRRLLGDRLTQAIIRSNRVNKSLAICYLDLDGFKSVNDQHGHAAGDQLLVGITTALKRILRGNDTLSRLGGDEFVLLLSDISSPGECTVILDRILQTINTPVQLAEATVTVSASIGVSLYPDDNADADTLLRHADQAMYTAKDAGKNRYQLFDPDSDRKAQIHRDYLVRLRMALERHEFVLHYQPKVNLITGELIGVEALIRWAHPERGLVPPGEFLRHIDGSDLESHLGNWVIDTALRQGSEWASQGASVSISVNVNVSANHLLKADFHDQLAQALARHPAMPATLFELEVLETAAIGDMDQAVSILGRCQALGVHFSLDDFGTGYSSLTYLRKLPVDTLKIDQSFVRDMLSDPDDLGIVEGVIGLASAFKRQVIAEGVETLAHGAALLSMGCHLAQGYGISRPMPAEQVLPWAEGWQVKKAWLALTKQG